MMPLFGRREINLPKRILELVEDLGEKCVVKLLVWEYVESIEVAF